MTNLADRLDSFAEPWMPDAGEKLIGEVVDLDERENEYGSYPVVTVLTDEGDELAFHAFRTVAKNELAKQRPQVGDRIGIKYVGKPEGKDYELYRIKVERDEQSKSIDWDKHTSEPAEPSAAKDDIPF
jgi:hypothetical protein